jgi:hypothetical protein
MQYETQNYLPVNAIFKDLAILLSDVIFILDDMFTKWAVFGEKSVIW